MADERASNSGGRLMVAITAAEDRNRLDKALAKLLAASGDAAAAGLSRSRLRALIEDGRVDLGGETVRDPSRKVKPGEIWRVAPPPPEPSRLTPETIALSILYEDAHLLVVDKPAGMTVHPAPGHASGTLVHALLAHCGDSLSGVGGEARPGVVHRIDKATSGLLVAAKTDAAHQGLAAQFAEHSVERAYLALVRGAPDRGDPRLAGLACVSFRQGWGRIEANIARHRTDRKRMAATGSGGRRAVTWFRTLARIGATRAPLAALLQCRLETGRTHQIRAHLSHVGHPLIGDTVYGRSRTPPSLGLDSGDARARALAEFPRQALHAAVLGFIHPVTGERLRFATPPPEDLAGLLALLGVHPAVMDLSPFDG